MTWIKSSARKRSQGQALRSPLNLSRAIPLLALGMGLGLFLHDTLPQAQERTPYHRSLYKHWTDADGDCQDARDEALISESKVAVVFSTPRTSPRDEGEGCDVGWGKWVDPYEPTKAIEDASKLDVDHMIPLAYAHAAGGWRWGPRIKELYANDLADPDHLVATQARWNRQKGARGPSEWLPPADPLTQKGRAVLCWYGRAWKRIARDWGLALAPPDAAKVVELEELCFPGWNASLMLRREP